jgi:hypothetical protein
VQILTDLFLSTNVDESSKSRSSYLSRHMRHMSRTHYRPIILLTLMCFLLNIIILYNKNKIMTEITTQNAAKQHAIFRANDHLSGVKPIFILESDVLGKPKADSGPDNGYKKEFLVPTEVYRTVIKAYLSHAPLLFQFFLLMHTWDFLCKSLPICF